MQKAVEEAQAEAMEKAAASSSGGPTQLTVGKAMEASKEAAARLAAKGLSQPPSSDPADGPSRSAQPSCCPCCLSIYACGLLQVPIESDSRICICSALAGAVYM